MQKKMENNSNFISRTLKSLLSVLCILVHTNAELTPPEVLGAEPRFKKQPANFKFLSKMGDKFSEIIDYDQFVKDTRMESALTLVVLYSNEYCLNCERQEEVFEEVYDRYKNHIK